MKFIKSFSVENKEKIFFFWRTSLCVLKSLFFFLEEKNAKHWINVNTWDKNSFIS